MIDCLDLFVHFRTKCSDTMRSIFPFLLIRPERKSTKSTNNSSSVQHYFCTVIVICWCLNFRSRLLRTTGTTGIAIQKHARLLKPLASRIPDEEVMMKRHPSYFGPQPGGVRLNFAFVRVLKCDTEMSWMLRAVLDGWNNKFAVAKPTFTQSTQFYVLK